MTTHYQCGALRFSLQSKCVGCCEYFSSGKNVDDDVIVQSVHLHFLSHLVPSPLSRECSHFLSMSSCFPNECSLEGVTNSPD